jgi:hypothetical protein
MFKSSPTPFDRSPEVRPLVKLLVHSRSLSPRFTVGDQLTTKLLMLGSFDFVEILATPDDDSAFLTALASFGVEAANVVATEGNWGLKRTHSSRMIGPVQTSIDYSEPVVPGSRVTWLDFIMARNLDYDYFVVDREDPLFSSSATRNNDISVEEAIDRVRLLSVRAGVFCILPNYRVDEGFYYLYRFKKIFGSFQKAYTTAVFGSMTNHARERLDSLAQRLAFICRAADQASIYSLGRAMHDNQDRSLAWFIAEYYNVQFNKMGVSIRKFSDNKPNDRFFIAIQAANSKLYQVLTAASFQTRLNLFYPVRNRLHHGVFINGVRVMGGTSDDGDKFVLPQEAISLMEELDGADYRHRWGVTSRIDRNFVDPHRYVSRSVEIAASIVNEFLDAFDWEALIAKLPAEQAIQIRESLERYNTGLGHFLGWSAEPLYF